MNAIISVTKRYILIVRVGVQGHRFYTDPSPATRPPKGSDDD